MIQTGASVDIDITNSALIWHQPKSLILLLAFSKFSTYFYGLVYAWPCDWKAKSAFMSQ